MGHAATVACTECSKVVPDPTGKRKTCSDACRAKRNRRMAKERKAVAQANSDDPHIQAIKAAINGDDVVHDVIADELRPMVRDVINTDNEVQQALQKIVGLTQGAIAALQADLLNPNPKIRQNAATLILKYTLGNPSVAPESADAHRPITINFDMPIADGPIEDGRVVEAQEVRTCDSCGIEKNVHEFQDDSDRCKVCFNRMRDKVAHLLE